MLIKCPECGNDISDKAVFCPKCGYPAQQLRANSELTHNAVAQNVAVAAETSVSSAEDSMIPDKELVNPQKTDDTKKKRSGCLHYLLRSLIRMFITLVIFLAICFLAFQGDWFGCSSNLRRLTENSQTGNAAEKITLKYIILQYIDLLSGK